MVTFRDVTVYFSQEERKCLYSAQKVSHIDVMLKNYSNLVSMVMKTIFSFASVNISHDIHSEEKQHKCKKYGKCSNPAEHKKPHTGEKPYELKECDNSILHFSILKSHYKNLPEEKPDKCKECGKSFYHLYYLRRHTEATLERSLTNVINGLNPLLFAQVSENIRKLTLERDLINIPTLTVSRVGTEWDKSFVSCSYFESHQRIHTGVKPYKCKECGKSFLSCSYLMPHQTIHTKNPTNAKSVASPLSGCQVLNSITESIWEGNVTNAKYGKSFKCLSDIKEHHRIHIGENRYQCNECDKSFTFVSTFIRHQKIHTGEKLYKYQESGKSFRLVVDIKEPQRIHVGEKSYKCKEANKLFAKSSDLKSHQRTHSGEKPSKCQEYEKSFK
ncbi:zinc finger protein 347-like [Nannospalax galili]|uniref:zinc finger protein 347-like n=1 Tax=Nannospalax galili TaxID=1026970 RepID=UPI0004ED642C|nr:zinc finger protein 347-like [Nannospalax galili]